MQITIREAAGYFGVDDRTVRRWIRQRGLPAHRVDEHLRLNPIEVWEWATEQGVQVSRRLLRDARRHPEPLPPLSALIEAGGVHYDVGGGDKSTVLREIVRRLPLPSEIDREHLVAVLEAREALGSTGIGDGIAIPHVRNPILLHVPAPFVTLCLLEHAVDFEAVDGRPVFALFTLVSPNVPAHLRILAQLGFVLRDETVREILRGRVPAPEILEAIRAVEGRTTGSYPAANAGP